MGKRQDLRTRRNGERSLAAAGRSARATAALWLALTCACHFTKSPPAVDRELASCIPPGAIILAGVHLDQLRATHLYQSVPQLLSGFQSLSETSDLMVAYDGREVIFAGRGKFAAAPAGATLVAPGLAVSGSTDSIHAAIAQHKTGASGSPRLVGIASASAAGRQIWVVAQGGVALPLSGNLSNLNRILHLSQYVTLAASIDGQVQIDSTAVGRNADASRQLEESLRAIVTLARAGNKQTDLDAVLNSIQIARDDLTVHATLSLSPEKAANLLHALAQ